MTGLKDEIDTTPEEYQTFVFPNPEHENTEDVIKDEEKACEYYEAAEEVSARLGVDGNVLVGELLVAAVECDSGDCERFEEIKNRLEGDT